MAVIPKHSGRFPVVLWDMNVAATPKRLLLVVLLFVVVGAVIITFTITIIKVLPVDRNDKSR